jgi:transcriptional regulator of acetoin/glycerol metabolism
VHPALDAAPVVLDAGQVAVVVSEGSDWVDVARQSVVRQQQSYTGSGHVLTLFDHEARMLASDGDPAALDGLAEINFRPGGAVGGSGGRHQRSGHRPRHRAGPPISWGPSTTASGGTAGTAPPSPSAIPPRERIAGVLDISGFREQAHPHTLNLAQALVVAIEQTLATREVERRFLTLQHFTSLTVRYPGDPILALDRGGRIVGATPSLAPALAEALAAEVRRAEHLPRESGVPVPVGDRGAALWFPVLQGRTIVGGCLVLAGGATLAGSEGIPFRPGDVKVYARRFFEAGARDLGRLAVEVEPAVYDALQAYDWPGNVRELKNVIRRVLLATTRQVRLHDLPRSIREAYAGSCDAPSSAIDREDALLMEVVNSSTTMAEAAARLGITRSTLYRRMARFGLTPTRVVRRQ